MNDINNNSAAEVSPAGELFPEHAERLEGAYNFRRIEKYWQQKWKETEIYKVPNNSTKPKCYVLDMFPYPSGAGLHVGHPLGYIASDIYARYKRLKGFNVLHPMGYDSFGLPAEQYALETGQHPAVTTEKNINTFRQQLDNIGFSFDWSREVHTSDPKYYKWTQWIFLQLFNSYFCHTENKAKPISELIKIFEAEGSSTINYQLSTINSFTAEQWNSFSEKEQQDILMNRRLAFIAYGEVNWCEALGTVLANDEVINGVSERGGHPVVKKKMRQWYLRITDYAERLLQGLETVDFSDAMKEMQRNWIGKSEGSLIAFRVKAPSRPSPAGKESQPTNPVHYTADPFLYGITKALSIEKRNNPTEAENLLWQRLKGNQTGFHFRRQHIIGSFIVDFVCVDKMLSIEVDGEYHNNPEQKKYDESRTEFLKENEFKEIRFTNTEVQNNIEDVISTIKQHANDQPSKIISNQKDATKVSPAGGDLEGALLTIFTTRPDTIFGVDFMVLAPEHELVNEITTPEQKEEIEKYIEYVKSRSERERLAEVKQITGAFTGAYAINPFDGREIPIWISEYVLAGYGTGAIMGVPCGDQRDFNFAKHFNIPITNIIGEHYNGEEANPTKDAILINSGFLNGMIMKDAIPVVLQKIEEREIGKRKVNYKMRDAGFSRQRYWGEPFPIVYKNGIAYALDEKDLPVELPHVENYKPGPEGEGPLANIPEWVNLTPGPSPKERGDRKIMENSGSRLDYMSTDADTWKTLKPFARENRKEQTEAENILWQSLRNRKIHDSKFRRQHAIGGFIVDFICIEKKLVIEIDGGYHNEEQQKKYDKARTEYLNEHGFYEIRFTNDEILQTLSSTIDQIEKNLIQNTPLLWRGNEGEVKRETNTMPGYAGSSWYFLRYMDPHNEEVFADKKVTDYWNQVDVYVGGTEHAVGHLLYSRMWTKVLYDLGLISFDEPFRKLVNQGMIQGSSRFVYRLVPRPVEPGVEVIHNSKHSFEPIFISYRFYKKLMDGEIHPQDVFTLIYNIPQEELSFYSYNLYDFRIDVKDVDGVELNIEAFRKSKPEYANATFILEDGKVLSFGEDLGEVTSKYICGVETEKMSKSKYNTVNPNDLIEKYGADTFRMYEMFLGPVEASKPWDTKGIEGVHRFLKKLWRLFFDEQKGKIWNEEKATDAELKVLHKTIKKIEEDTERFSYNTAVSAFMVCVNELTDLNCHKKEILEPLLILLTPYAPHIAEELYHSLQNDTSILDTSFPKFNPQYLIESSKEYPISVNGKMRTIINISLDASQQEVEKIVLQNDIVKKWIEEKQPKKIIYVKNKMVNVVV